MPSRTSPAPRALGLSRRSVLRIGLGSIGAAALSATVANQGLAQWEEDEILYIVVMNHEEQYSIWPANREVPLGWRPEGFQGTKLECLAHVEAVWTDMRPRSLRDRMEATGEEPRP